MLLEKLEYFEN